MLEEVLNQIGRRQKFILTSHARPDGDAVGSALACCQILRSMGKQADVVLSDGVPGIYRPLPYADSVLLEIEQAPSAEAAIILECDGVARTRLTGLENHYLINIDHHATARPFADVNWIDPNACATAEMIFRLAREAGVKISPEVATCLYTAVLTDTGSFCFTGTTERTFALAQELVRCGADPVKIAHSVYFSTQLSKMRLLGRGPQYPPSRRQFGLDARLPQNHGTLRVAGRRLRRTGELRAGHRGHRSRALLPRAAGRTLPREPAQQRRGQRRRRGRSVWRRRPRVRQRLRHRGPAVGGRRTLLAQLRIRGYESKVQ